MSHPTRLFFAVSAIFLSGFLNACDSGSSPGTEPAPATPTEPEVPALPPCTDNVDCQGGEVCRNEECRTACTDDDGCSGFYGRCQVAAGYCVACVEQADCDDDEACTASGLCEFYCSADEQCPNDSFCDEQSGECLERECEENADCPGGYECSDYRCLNLDPIVCDAETTTCDGNTIVVCNRDGTREERTACPEDFICVEADDTATCVERICTPNAFGCLDGANAFACDATGTEQTTLPCRNDQYCASGVCRNQQCVPDSVTCEGNTLVTCDALGSDRDASPCASTTACVGEAFGCACIVDECIARTCRPEARECVGNGFRSCNANGTGFGTPEACADACAAGACVSSTCVPGESQCSGDRLIVCNAAGNDYDVTDCSTSGETCVTAGDTSSCSAPICEPLSTTCTDDRTGVVTCNAFGTASTAAPCDAEQFCDAGVCRNQVCTPDARECVGTTSVNVCSALGDDETTTPCDAGQQCSNGICSTPACVPDCSGRACGADPICGESCGTCAGEATCNPAGQCVAPNPNSELEIVLSWPAGTDLDLYLAREPNDFCSVDNCFYGNCQPNSASTSIPEWDGVNGRTSGDPVLTDDATDGGEERISVAAPLDDVYRAMVHHYSSGFGEPPPATATVTVTHRGVVVGTLQKQLAGNDVWDGIRVVKAGANTTISDVGGTYVKPDCSPPDPTDGGPGPDLDAGPGPDGGAAVCTTNAQCEPDEFCSVVFFVGACAQGCRNDSGCSNSQRCNGSGVCVSSPLKGWQESCTENADCIAGLNCGFFSGTCVETCQEGCTDCCPVSNANFCNPDLLGLGALCSN